MVAVAVKGGEKIPSIKFDLKPDEILSKTKGTIERCLDQLQKIGATPAGERSFESVIWPLSQLERTIQTDLSAETFLQYVSTEEDVRNASVEATKLLNKYSIDKATRQDLFEVVTSVAQNASEMQSLDGESRRLVDKMTLEFKHSGLFLGAEERERLKGKRERLAELQVDFSKNMNEDKTEILFTAKELEGCPADFLENLEERDGKYVLTMKYPDVFGVLKNARDEDVRKRMDIAFNSKCPQNAAILEEAVQLRYECAKLLGYANHAEYRLEECLAKKPAAVIEFERDLRSRLTAIAEGEVSKLKQMKVQEGGDVDACESEDGGFGSWDYHYYSRQLLERDYQIDNEKLKEYYSLEMVIAEMLRIYEEVLGLEFAQVADGHVWHDDVLLYKVCDAASKEFVGHFYLDLFPRPGKYTHAACFDLQPGCTLALDGSTRQYPVAAMVANFSKPTASKPSLLKHDEVVTLFHELGHAMHDMCAKATYSRFHGTSVETDFVEAPSQMLENWCWDDQMLKRISRHYLHPEQTLSDEQIRQLVRAKNFHAGLTNLRQIFFGIFDMTIHSIEAPLREAFKNESIDELYARLRGEIALIPQPRKVSPASSFGHMMGGYDAGYYGYMWSQVFSADMFYSRFKRDGVIDARVGLDYREKILRPGGSRDGMESLEAFLGRKPTSAAFLKSLGLDGGAL